MITNQPKKKFLEDQERENVVFGHLLQDFIYITKNILELTLAFVLIMLLTVIEVILIIPLRLITTGFTYLTLKKSVRKMLKPAIMGDIIVVIILIVNCVRL